MHRFKLTFPYLDSFIFLLTNEFKPLKVQYKFSKKFEDNFLIYPEDFTDKIGKLFGFKEFQIGDNEFDSKYFIKGTNFDLIKKILNQDTKTYMLSNHISNLKLYTNENWDTLELNLRINELEKEELNKVYKLFKNLVPIVINEAKCSN